MKEDSTVLGKGERRAPAQSYDWNSLGEDGGVAETSGELEGERKLEIAMVEKGILPVPCIFFAGLAVRLTRTSARIEVQSG